MLYANIGFWRNLLFASAYESFAGVCFSNRSDFVSFATLNKIYGMAHHKSAIKRIRQSAKRRAENRYYGKTTRNLIAKLRATTDKTEALKLLPQVVSRIDRLVKRNQIHWKKAANLKSSVMIHVNKLK
ncbi:MAG: hypothetical protein KatS3mg031_1153 [Chitinophagales bacterium]|nr:MAG: hypothetical protein KatS3mg031_1153 [Chitinophagales bacterium]